MRPDRLVRWNYTVFYRTTISGEVGPLNRRFFDTAHEVLDFLGRIDDLRSTYPVLASVKRREVGSWHDVERLDLEAAAAEEGGAA